ncbi:esterase/lipase family protein [Planctomyces sp. SH-PL62]|uniref:esterase/lipase family protein n=1 Tax=Planctomyces sp. SH-PL62 TaxID=1636152 RepID=UPI00078BE66A|nr:alpha/beta hydrolase [Planctomyces sp. SH-PL62]AMV36411.1 hypothetical protein VT85_03195 [Planctomyces sp. SH-PL62]
MGETRPAGVPYARRRFLFGAAMAMSAPSLLRAGAVDPDHALHRAASAWRRAVLARKARAPECVDLYYESAVFAFAAMAACPDPSSRDAAKAQSLYNDSLGDCLRAAMRHGAIDPRSRLIVQTPSGARHVPIVHHGFVWSPEDFQRLVDPDDAPRNPSNSRDHTRAGVGATQVVERKNPHARIDDAFLPDVSYFPATAVLRPDLDAWLGGVDGGPGDVLEFHDPLRVRSVPLAGVRRRLAGDIDSPISFLEESTGGRESGWAGLVNPSQEIHRAFLGMLEPFQPGKIPIVFVHGLYDTPYTFTDLMNGLRAKPGFLDRYQILGFRYPTGITFLHSAALFRGALHRFEATLDPSQSDPGVQNTVLIGHSMGGLLSKFQVVSSGEAFYDLALSRPLASLVTSEASRAFLANLFYFDPVPFVRRAIFVATPHDGSALVTQPVGRIGDSLIQQPEDLRPLIAQLERDNPGAVRRYMHDLPSSIAMLRRRDPTLRTLRSRATSPDLTIHTLAGTAGLPLVIARGDGVVPIPSALHGGAESQTLVPEIHTTINSSEYTLVEVDRILRRHAATTETAAR